MNYGRQLSQNAALNQSGIHGLQYDDHSRAGASAASTAPGADGAYPATIDHHHAAAIAGANALTTAAAHHHHQYILQQQRAAQHQPGSTPPPLPQLTPVVQSQSPTTAALPPQQKSRSVMACVLCRKQKMKCEGPEKAPCKRCRTAGVDCTFESPPTSTPRSRPAPSINEALLDARFSAVEERLSNLESAQSAIVPSDNATATRQNTAIVTEHERRIVALEAQVYALSLSAQAHQHAITSSGHPPPPGPSMAPGSAQSSNIHSHTNLAALASTSRQPTPNPAPSHGASSSASSNAWGHQHPQYSTQDFAHYSHTTAPASAGVYSHAIPASTMRTSAMSAVAGSHPDWFDVSSVSAGGSHQDNFSSNMVSGGLKYEDLTQPTAYAHRDKRRKSLHCNNNGLNQAYTASAYDFIARGLVTEEEASLCFESYFLTFAHPSATPSSLESDPHAPVKPLNGIQRPIRLPFGETRARSSLLLATLISIGARSLNRFDTYKTTLREAIRLCHATFLSEPGEEPTSLDLKGIMLLSLYNGLPELMSHGITLSYRFGMPTALLEYERLSREEKSSKKGLVLLRRGRTFLVSFLWTSFYSYCRGQHGFYHIPSEVIRHQLDLLESSEFAQQPSDTGIRVNVEENLILRDVFDQLGPGMRITQPSYDELCDMIGAGIQRLVSWNQKWNDETMEMITQWGDSREIKTVVPLHHGRMSLLMYIFRDMVVDDTARAYPKMREFARLGSESAVLILRWGLESRIWLPHSMVAQYLHHVNIPTAVSLLYTCTRLFPEDANMLLIRNLLHRLLKQCDLCIAGNNGTEHEVVRAHETKRIVLEFDRFAFAFEEASASAVGRGDAATNMSLGLGPEPDDHLLGDSSSSSARHVKAPLSGTNSNSGVKSEEEAGLFGEEITASLGAMSLELNLWGGILEGALED